LKRPATVVDLEEEEEEEENDEEATDEDWKEDDNENSKSKKPASKKPVSKKKSTRRSPATQAAKKGPKHQKPSAPPPKAKETRKVENGRNGYRSENSDGGTIDVNDETITRSLPRPKEKRLVTGGEGVPKRARHEPEVDDAVLYRLGKAEGAREVMGNWLEREKKGADQSSARSEQRAYRAEAALARVSLHAITAAGGRHEPASSAVQNGDTIDTHDDVLAWLAGLPSALAAYVKAFKEGAVEGVDLWKGKKLLADLAITDERHVEVFLRKFKELGKAGRLPPPEG
jgi:hypothetical protein